MSKYLAFRLDTPARDGRKTEVWGVYSTSSDGLLGRIAWFGRWRQYTFSPANETTFNPDCLRDIAAHCAWLTRRHRDSSRAAYAALPAPAPGENTTT